MKVLRILGLAIVTVFFSAIGVLAQANPAHTVTNSDLEKYRDARVKADDEYRQTYARRGLPSPEELEKREEERQKRLTELSLKLREERLQKEYVEGLKAASANPDVVYAAPQNNYSAPGFSYYPYGFVTGVTGRRHPGVRFRALSNVELVRQQAGMFSSATQLINERRNDFRGNFRTGRKR